MILNCTKWHVMTAYTYKAIFPAQCSGDKDCMSHPSYVQHLDRFWVNRGLSVCVCIEWMNEQEINRCWLHNTNSSHCVTVNDEKWKKKLVNPSVGLSPWHQINNLLFFFGGGALQKPRHFSLHHSTWTEGHKTPQIMAQPLENSQMFCLWFYPLGNGLQFGFVFRKHLSYQRKPHGFH